MTQTRPDLLAPIRYSDSGVTSYDPGAAYNGLTLIQGLLPGGLQVRLKRHKRGPWVRQHDPDITPEGNITIFNNRSVRLHSFFDEGSQILSSDPASDQTIVLHPAGKDD